MRSEEIIEKIRTILADEFEVNIELIQPEANLMKVLRLDSLDMVDIVVLVEQNFGFAVTSKDFIGVQTVQDFYSFVISHMKVEE
jgi:acyl carrier protein